MRMPKHLSASSFLMYKQNRDKFVQTYLTDTQIQREAQTPAMAIGSSFDAFAKNELARCILGGSTVKQGEPFHLQTLFEKQVQEEALRTWAWEEGGFLFLRYKDLGAFDELLTDLEGHQGDVIFDLECVKEIELPSGFKVPVKGYPDCAYVHRSGVPVILDWKCNNYCGVNKKSPSKHYVVERPSGRSHKDIQVELQDGLKIQKQYCFSEVDVKWATQLTMYSWLLGYPIENDAIVQIDQLLCQPGQAHHPDIRAVTYRGFVNKAFQNQLAVDLEQCWTAIQSGHIYHEVPREESDRRVAALERHAAMSITSNPIMDILNTMKGKTP